MLKNKKLYKLVINYRFGIDIRIRITRNSKKEE